MPRRLLHKVDWRLGADFAKRRPMLLRLADRMGRGTGRLRFLDHVRRLQQARPIDLETLNTAPTAAGWIGHATVLIRLQGKLVLTDPAFLPRVGVGYILGTIGPRRRTAAALSIPRLPPLDLLLLTHAHFDHLDRPSLWRIARRFPEVPVIVARETADLVQDLGFRHVIEMSWGERRTVAGIDVSAIPVRHWGPRVFFDTWRTYNAYHLHRQGHAVIFGGDTAETDSFRGAGPVDLMCIGIGAYDPYIAAHANPEQAWEMTRHAQARHVLPMHHSTFRLSHEAIDEPLRRFLAAAGDEQWRVVVRQVGDTWHLPADQRPISPGNP